MRLALAFDEPEGIFASDTFSLTMKRGRISASGKLSLTPALSHKGEGE
jgi:hypothetical protein